MSSWKTVKDKDSTETPPFDRESVDPEPSTELGIFKLRATYNRGLNSLNCSRDPHDAQSIESRHCFESIIQSVSEKNDETAATRKECTLLLFLAYSNLSRMVAKTDERGLALTYALNAANTMSIAESSFLDPGLLLRIAKLSFEDGDLWSCSHLLGYRISRENGVKGPVSGGLLDSYYHLSERLERKLFFSSQRTTTAPSAAAEKLLISMRENSSSSCLPKYSAFNDLAYLLALRDPSAAAEFSVCKQKLCLDVMSISGATRNFDDTLYVSRNIPSDLCDLTELSDQGVVQLDRTATAAASAPHASIRRLTSEPYKGRSSSASEPKAPHDNIAHSLSRRKKEGTNHESLRNARFTSLKDILFPKKGFPDSNQKSFSHTASQSDQGGNHDNASSSHRFLENLESFLCDMIEDDCLAGSELTAEVNTSSSSSSSISERMSKSIHERAVQLVYSEEQEIRENTTDVSVVLPPLIQTSNSNTHCSRWKDLGSLIRESLQQFLEREVASNVNSVSNTCDLLLCNILPLDGESDYMSDITVHATFISTAAEYVHHNVLANILPNDILLLNNHVAGGPTRVKSSEIFLSVSFLDIGNAVLVSWMQIIRSLGASMIDSLLRSLNAREVLLLAECCLDALMKIKSSGNQYLKGTILSGNKSSDVIGEGNMMNVPSEISDSRSIVKDDTFDSPKDRGSVQFHHVLRCIFLMWSEGSTHVGAKEDDGEGRTLDRDSADMPPIDIVRGEDSLDSTAMSDALYNDKNVAEVSDLAVMLQFIRKSWILIGYAELQSDSDNSSMEGSGKRKRMSNGKAKNKKKKDAVENSAGDDNEIEDGRGERDDATVLLGGVKKKVPKNIPEAASAPRNVLNVSIHYDNLLRTFSGHGDLMTGSELINDADESEDESGYKNQKTTVNENEKCRENENENERGDRNNLERNACLCPLGLRIELPHRSQGWDVITTKNILFQRSVSSTRVRITGFEKEWNKLNRTTFINRKKKWLSECFILLNDSFSVIVSLCCEFAKNREVGNRKCILDMILETAIELKDVKTWFKIADIIVSSLHNHLNEGDSPNSASVDDGNKENPKDNEEISKTKESSRVNNDLLFLIRLFSAIPSQVTRFKSDDASNMTPNKDHRATQIQLQQFIKKILKLLLISCQKKKFRIVTTASSMLENLIKEIKVYSKFQNLGPVSIELIGMGAFVSLEKILGGEISLISTSIETDSVKHSVLSLSSLLKYLLISKNLISKLSTLPNYAHIGVKFYDFSRTIADGLCCFSLDWQMEHFKSKEEKNSGTRDDTNVPASSTQVWNSSSSSSVIADNVGVLEHSDITAPVPVPIAVPLVASLCYSDVVALNAAVLFGHLFALKGNSDHADAVAETRDNYAYSSSTNSSSSNQCNDSNINVRRASSSSDYNKVNSVNDNDDGVHGNGDSDSGNVSDSDSDDSNHNNDEGKNESCVLNKHENSSKLKCNRAYKHSIQQIYQCLLLLHDISTDQAIYRPDHGDLGLYASKLIHDWLIGRRRNQSEKLSTKQLKECLAVLGQIYGILFHFPIVSPQGDATSGNLTQPLPLESLHHISRLHSFAQYSDTLGNVFGKAEIRASVAMIFKTAVVQDESHPSLRRTINDLVFFNPTATSSSSYTSPPSSSSSSSSVTTSSTRIPSSSTSSVSLFSSSNSALSSSSSSSEVPTQGGEDEYPITSNSIFQTRLSSLISAITSHTAHTKVSHSSPSSCSSSTPSSSSSCPPSPSKDSKGITKLLSTLYYDVIRLGVQRTTTNSNGINNGNDLSINTDTHVGMEDHICWTIEMTLRDLSYSPMRVESWLSLHTKLSEWLQRVCDEVGDLAIPSDLPTDVHNILVEGSLERILGGRNSISDAFSRGVSTSTNRPPPQFVDSSIPNSASLVADAARTNNASTHSSSSTSLSVPATTTHSPTRTPVSHDTVNITPLTLQGLEVVHTSTTADSRTLDPWSRIYGTPREFLNIYSKAGVVPKDDDKDVEREKEKEKDKGKDKTKDKDMEKDEKEKGTGKSRTKTDSIDAISESRICRLCNFLTLKNSIGMALENVFHLITAISAPAGEMGGEGGDGQESVGDVMCVDEEVQVQVEVDGGQLSHEKEILSKATRDRENDTCNDDFNSKCTMNKMKSVFLYPLEDDLEMMYENQGLAYYNMSQEYSKMEMSKTLKFKLLGKSYFCFSEACRISSDDSPFLIAMCGKLSYQLKSDIKESLALLIKAREINEKKDSSKSVNSQKQLRVFILYELSAYCSKVAISALQNGEHSLSEEILRLLEESSFSRAPFEPCVGVSSSAGGEEGKSISAVYLSCDDPLPLDADGMYGTCDREISESECERKQLVQERHSIERDAPTSSFTTQHTPAQTPIEENTRIIRIWHVISNCLAGLIECRRIDSYHSLSLHKVSKLLRTLADMGLQPPLRMQNIHPLVLKGGNTSNINSHSKTTAPISATITFTTIASDSTSMHAISADYNTTSRSASILISDFGGGLPDPTVRDLARGVGGPVPGGEEGVGAKETEIPADIPKIPPVQGMEISLCSAFSESGKLFDKKRPQIVALWCLETATNGCERILQRTYKFDSLRRKMILQYFELAVSCDNFTAIVAVLQSTLTVSSRQLTATLRWVIRSAVDCCTTILNRKYEQILVEAESRQREAEIAAQHVSVTGPAAAVSVAVAGIDSTRDTTANTIMTIPSAVMDVQSHHGTLPDSNQMNGASTISTSSSILQGCTTLETTNTDIAPTLNAISNTNKGPRTDHALTLETLKKGFDLYNLVSKVLGPSDLKGLKDVVIQLHSMTDLTATRAVRTVGTTGSKKSQEPDKSVRTPASNTDPFLAGIVESFPSVLADCVRTWSARASSSGKRSRTVTGTGTGTALPVSTSLLSAPLALPSTDKDRSVERPAKISRSDFELSRK